MQLPSRGFFQMEKGGPHGLIDAFTDVSVRGLNTLLGHGPINPSVDGDDETDNL